MNSVILLGRLARDPELSFIPSTGLAVTKFSLAVDKDMSKDKKEQAKQQGKQTADFINITVFGKSAENCANFLAKGSQCAIQGRINTGSYTTQSGEKRYTTDVIADRVNFLDPKGQAKPSGNSYGTAEDAYYQSNSDSDDLFTPVDDEDIPF